MKCVPISHIDQISSLANSPCTYRLFIALTDYKITTTLNSFSSQSNVILPSYFFTTSSTFFKSMPCSISTSGRRLYFSVAGTALPVLCGLLWIISCYALASKLLCILFTFTISALASGIPLFAFPHASLYSMHISVCLDASALVVYIVHPLLE